MSDALPSSAQVATRDCRDCGHAIRALVPAPQSPTDDREVRCGDCGTINCMRPGAHIRWVGGEEQ